MIEDLVYSNGGVAQPYFSGAVQEPAPVAADTATEQQRDAQERWSILRALLSAGSEAGTPRFGIPECVSLAVFVLTLVWVIPHHESWFDEVQAWMIARDSTLRDLVAHRLHYEGTPALWHLLLWVEYHARVSFFGMRVIAGAIATGGVFVWLRFNPLPRWISILIPWTFFLQYQYAVVARSYVLCPVLAFSLMALYAARRSKPVWFAVVAGLLANCSLHMAALSVGLVVLYVHDRLPGWRASGLRKIAVPAGVLGLMFVASVATAVPTPDGSSTTANPIVSSIRNLLSGKPASVKVAVPQAGWESTAGLDAAPPPQGLFATGMWRLIHPGSHASSKQLLMSGVVKHCLVLMAATTVPVSTSNLLAGVFLVLVLLNVVWARQWFAVVPYLLVQACNVLISGEAHHLGLLWVALLCTLWAVALQPARYGGQGLARRVLWIVAGLVAVLQVGWSIHAVRADVAQPYSSSKETAAFLAGLPAGARVAAFDDDSITVNAFLPRSPYFNEQVDYWPFSKTRNSDLLLEKTMATHPDYVVLKMAAPEAPVTNQWVVLVAPGTEFTPEPTHQLVVAAGYHETHRFCGHRFFRNASESRDCRVIYERDSSKLSRQQ